MVDMCLRITGLKDPESPLIRSYGPQAGSTDWNNKNNLCSTKASESLAKKHRTLLISCNDDNKELLRIFLRIIVENWGPEVIQATNSGEKNSRMRFCMTLDQPFTHPAQ